MKLATVFFFFVASAEEIFSVINLINILIMN